MVYIGFYAEFLALANETICSHTNICYYYLLVKIRTYAAVEIQCGIPQRGSLSDFPNGPNMSWKDSASHSSSFRIYL